MNTHGNNSIEHVEEIACSDFILAKTRSVLKDPFQYSVDWRMLGAFNGAVLSDEAHAVQILFFSPGHSYDSPSSIPVTLPNMTLSIYIRDAAQLSVSTEELISSVKSWWSEFQHHRMDSPAIKRLHVQLQSSSSAKSDSKSAHSRFLQELESCIPDSRTVHDPNGEVWIAPDVDEEFIRQLYPCVETEAELVLTCPLDAAKMEACLRTLLPTMPALRLGADAVISSTECSELNSRDIDLLTLAPRAF